MQMEKENIVIRLKYFMESEGLTSTQFADRVGIPRPSFSQILSGRNKKISDVIITQIHQGFPNLSIAWLLFGEGEMMVVPKVLKEAESDLGLEVAEFEDLPLYGNAPREFQNVEPSNTQLDTMYYPNNKKVNNPKYLTPKNGQIENNETRVKKIVSITVFFDDNSFETFTPGKK